MTIVVFLWVLCSGSFYTKEKLQEPPSLKLIHPQKLDAEFQIHSPSYGSGFHRDGDRLVRHLQMNLQHIACCDGQVTGDLAPTHAEVVYDPKACMVSLEPRRKLDEESGVLTLIDHS